MLATINAPKQLFNVFLLYIFFSNLSLKQATIFKLYTDIAPDISNFID